MKEIYEYLEAQKEAYLEELFAFLRARSISTTGDGVRECAGLLKSIMEKSGIKTTVFETEHHPVVYGEWITSPHLPTMLVYGHYDVQPAEPLEAWHSDPFEPVIRDGRIYCRGASDNKAQLFTHIKAFEAWRKVKGSLPVNVKYLFEGEEEIGSPDLAPFVEAHKELLQCDVCFYSDSHYHESGRPQINLGVKGLCYVEITVTEAATDLHSMMAASICNPAWRLVRLLDTFYDENGRVAVRGFYDDVRPVNGLEQDAVSRIPCDEALLKEQYGVSRFRGSVEPGRFYHNLIFEPTCNISGLVSGYTGEGSKTVLPGQASVKLDMRLVPDQKPEQIYRLVREHLDRHGFEDARLTHYGMVAPSRTPLDNPYVNVAAGAVQEGFEEEPILFPGIGGVAPDYVFTGILGVPTMVLPYAAADQKNHAPNESMVLTGFYKGIRTSAALIWHLGKEKITDE